MNIMKKNILHITAHMGGGVGKVLSGVSSFAKSNRPFYHHKILLLEKPEKLNFIEICEKNGVEVVLASDHDIIEKEIKQADIVQVEWWHHPMLMKFLLEFPKIEIRLIIWSHISGCHYPWIPLDFLRIPHKFIFTSPYSYDNPYWDEADRIYARKNCDMIHSSGGFSNIISNRIGHSGFNVGYVGTQSFSKIHPEFIKYCKKISYLPGVHFIMVGDKTNQDNILLNADKENISNQFEFVDYVKNVGSELSRFDVFGYILNPTHFGTTENVLLEAMAAGVPVVCLNQCAEQYLIRHNETGILVENIEDYEKAIVHLYNHPLERERLGQNAKRFVNEQFSVVKTVERLHEVYDNVKEKKPRIFDFSSHFGNEAFKWFLAFSSPIDREKFQNCILNGIYTLEGRKMLLKDCKIIFKEKNKSSVSQFARYFPEVQELKQLEKLIQG